MFEILDKLSDTIVWPVTAKVAAHGGDVTELKFHAEFKRLDDARVQEMNDPASATRPKTDKALQHEVLVSVGEMVSGQYQAAGAEEQARLLGTFGVRKAITFAYQRVLAGEKEKNS